MIISRTPFRVSFLGGGTDYPAWYRDHPGAVLAASINKYCYISVRSLPPFFDYRSRILYAKVEHVDEIDEIQHPVVREALRFLGVDRGLEIHHDGDIPARTGLGSSSSFTVGLLHALYAMQQTMVSKERLASEAFHLEHDILAENVGAQDQTIAAHGGLNRIDFFDEHAPRITPLPLRPCRLKELAEHCLMLFTGFTRSASQVAGAQIRNTPNRVTELSNMYELVSEGVDILTGEKDIVEFGHLLHESWQLKRCLTDKISTAVLDSIYEEGRSAGAIGGKVLGAGGGGFMLFVAPPDAHTSICERLGSLLRVPFDFEDGGSRIIFYDPSNNYV